jgi:hypothetical protein
MVGLVGVGVLLTGGGCQNSKQSYMSGRSDGGVGVTSAVKGWAGPPKGSSLAENSTPASGNPYAPPSSLTTRTSDLSGAGGGWNGGASSSMGGGASTSGGLIPASGAGAGPMGGGSAPMGGSSAPMGGGSSSFSGSGTPTSMAPPSGGAGMGGSGIQQTSDLRIGGAGASAVSDAMYRTTTSTDSLPTRSAPPPDNSDLSRSTATYIPPPPPPPVPVSPTAASLSGSGSTTRSAPKSDSVSSAAEKILNDTQTLPPISAGSTPKPAPMSGGSFPPLGQ